MSGWLEHKIPPPVITGVVALLMWLVARVVSRLTYEYPGRLWVAVAIAVAGLSVILAGVVGFAKAKTTVNPLRPDAASVVVSSGIYRITRNPMYLGMLMLLIGWAAFLGNAVALVPMALFVPYMNRFQILPEERALTAKFGAPYEAYLQSVRRWL